jgi:hypothetical protein
MNVTAYVEDKSTSEFYPTPNTLIEKMYNKVDWNYVQTVLEPSAGAGDIIKYLNTKREDKPLNIDAIELDSNLRTILLYTFSEDNENRILTERKKIHSKYNYIEKKYHSKIYTYYSSEAHEYVPIDENDQNVMLDTDRQLLENGKGNVHIVSDDFLKYNPYKTYNLIMMNPPFSDGDKHLLKALEIQKYGGQIVCILNAETLRNPYTESRKHLVNLLDTYNANIEYISNAFMSNDTSRKTGVDIALIYVNIPATTDDISIFEKMAKAKSYSEPTEEEKMELEVVDFIKNYINRYKVEVESGIELIKMYSRMKPYILDSFDESNYPSAIMRLTDKSGHNDITINEYVASVRLKYWREFLVNPKIIGKLTSAMQEKYHKKIESLREYDFSEFNITKLMAEINSQIKTGVEDETEKMFDRLTSHAIYEGTSNIWMYTGWKTNEAYKIGKKVILPARSVFSSWGGHPRAYDANNVLSDVERVLNFFDGNMCADVDMINTLDRYFAQGVTKNIPLKYFTATFYKKGTVHITFTRPDLIDRYNIYIGKQRAWLPPCYGDKTYADMSSEEKAVIDSFQGEKEYNHVMSNKEYYLKGIVNSKQNLIGLSD